MSFAHPPHFFFLPFLPSHFLDLAEVFNRNALSLGNMQGDNKVFVPRDHRGTVCNFTRER